MSGPLVPIAPAGWLARIRRRHDLAAACSGPPLIPCLRIRGMVARVHPVVDAQGMAPSTRVAAASSRLTVASSQPVEAGPRSDPVAPDRDAISRRCPSVGLPTMDHPRVPPVPLKSVATAAPYSGRLVGADGQGRSLRPRQTPEVNCCKRSLRSDDAYPALLPSYDIAPILQLSQRPVSRFRRRPYFSRNVLDPR